jgi:hypothetical protein
VGEEDDDGDNDGGIDESGDRVTLNVERDMEEQENDEGVVSRGISST